MKRIKTYKIFNESLRDKMVSKSKEDIKQNILNIKNPIKKFHKSIIYGFVDIVNDLIVNNKVEPNRENNTPIILACENGQLDIVKELLKYDGVNISIHDNMAIDLAAQRGHYDVIKYIIDNKLVPKSNLLYSANLAYENGHDNIGRLIDNYINSTNESLRDKMVGKSKGEIKDSMKYKSSYDNLITSCVYGYLDLVKDIVEHKFSGLDINDEPIFGIDPSMKDNHAIKVAMYNNHYDVVEYLFNDKRVNKKMSRIEKLKVLYYLFTEKQKKINNIINNTNESIRDKMVGKSNFDFNKEVKKIMDEVAEFLVENNYFTLEETAISFMYENLIYDRIIELITVGYSGEELFYRIIEEVDFQYKN